MARTITQISAGSDTTLFALCSDGTVWRKDNVGSQVPHRQELSEQPWIEVETVLQLIFPVHITDSFYVQVTYHVQ